MPLGTYTDCVKTFDWAPHDKGRGNTYFCKDIGAAALEVDLVGPETPRELFLKLIELDKTGASGMSEVPAQYTKDGVTK